MVSGRMTKVHKDSEDYRSGFDFGYARGKADSKGAALQTIADALVVIAYVNCLAFRTDYRPDEEMVSDLEDYLYPLLPLHRHKDAEEDNGEGGEEQDDD